MSTNDAVAELRLVGGSLALDFVNTRWGPPTGGWDTDVLDGYDALVAWAEHAGGLSPTEAEVLRTTAHSDPAGAEDATRRSLAARDDLDALFRSLAAGQEPAARLLRQLAEYDAEALSHAHLDASAGFRWSWTGEESLRRPLYPVLHAAVELLTSGRLGRLKGCQGCSYLFLDESKNRSRRWCSMSDCGTETKMRRYVAARRSRAAASRLAPRS